MTRAVGNQSYQVFFSAFDIRFTGGVKLKSWRAHHFSEYRQV